MEVQMVLVLLFSLIWTGGVRAQTSGCTSVLIGMAPCLSYVTGGSSTPSSSCCSKLASVVQSQPQCLCSALDGSAGSALGITVNRTIALGLPAACNVKTPPVSRCNQAANGAGSPVASPVGSPDASPPENSGELAPGSPHSSSVSGSKTVPSNGLASGSSTTNTKKSILQLITFVLVFASYVSA